MNLSRYFGRILTSLRRGGHGAVANPGAHGSAARDVVVFGLAFSALLAAAGCATHAPAPTPAAGIAAEPLPRDTTVLTGTLENGLRYYIRANNEPRHRVELRLALDVGSILEDDDQRGLAHMVEHMAFNGTTNFSSNELVDYLESVGMRFGPDVNAYVSFDETVYILTLPTDTPGVVEKGLQILEDWAHGITFDPTEVAKERGVVIEEWRLHQGAGERVRQVHLPRILQGSRYTERLPIGTRESLDSFEIDALERFYRDWYRSDLMAVVVVGDIEPRAIEAAIRERFGKIPPAAEPRARPAYPVPGHDETIFSVAADPELTTSTVTITKKIPVRPSGTTASYRRWLVESLAGSVLIDRLIELTRQPGAPLIDVGSFQGRYMRPLEALVLTATVPDTTIEDGLRVVFTEMERIAQHGVGEPELERKKAELFRMAEQRYAEREKITSATFAGEYVSHFLYGGEIIDADTEYELYRRLLPGITAEEIRAVISFWLDPANRAVTVSVPDKEGVAVPGEESLAAVVRSVGEKDTEPYDDVVSDAPLIAELPAAAPIVTEREYPGAGVLEWELANGVRVLLRPTDFQEDLVLLAGRSPGGTSLLPDEDYVTSLLTIAIVQAGGAGALSTSDLQKRLAGTHVSVGTSLEPLSENVSGVASAKDLELLFQLVYLKMTAPRVDSTAIEAYRLRARTLFENRGSSPEWHLQDTLRATLTQGHPRARSLSTADLERLDIDRAFEIYLDRFGDASDFTFYIVGNFEPNSLRPYVERYLGGLPAAGRAENWRDLGIRPPRGVVRKVVRKGLEPRGTVQLVFTGEFDFGRDALARLVDLRDLLQIRLREKLREDLAGTYGVRIDAYGIRDPRPEYRLAISFSADPERLDELVDVVFAEIESIQNTGPLPGEVDKIREMQRRSHEVRLRENQYWIAQLINYDRHGWDLDQIGRPATPPGTPESINAIRDAARRFLDPSNYIRVDLLPELGAKEEVP